MEKNNFNAEELAYASHDKIDALIDLLIKKGLITESEFVDSLKELYIQMEQNTPQK